jgi:hypothetical protein
VGFGTKNSFCNENNNFRLKIKKMLFFEQWTTLSKLASKKEW